MDASKEGVCHLRSIVDSSSVIKTPASPWTCRIDWAPVTANDQSAFYKLAWTNLHFTRYDVKFTCPQTGRRLTLRTPDDAPCVVIQNRLMRQKVGDTFTVQIRVLNSEGIGQWSETSEVLSVAKPSPNLPLGKISARPQTQKLALPSPSELAQECGGLEALPYTVTRNTVTRKAPAKGCGDTARHQGSVLEHFMSKFRRATAKS